MHQRAPRVGRARLEEALRELAASGFDPRWGIHRPDSLAWEINRENVLFLGGGCAALLQLAHPAVASAIAQHSRTRGDVWGRFWRTFRNVWAMSFGDFEQAASAARRVHAIHSRVFGPLEPGTGAGPAASYRANDPSALLWVYATLLDTSIQVFQLVVRPLSEAERDRYVVQSHAFARLFGIPRELLPPTHAEFAGYMRRMAESAEIDAWPPARSMADYLLHRPPPGLGPWAAWYRVMTAGLLPPRLRQGFGLPFGTEERRRFGRSIGTLRRWLPRLPGLVRFLPAYHAARRRVRHPCREAR